MSTELTPIPTASMLSVIERAAVDPTIDVAKMERLLVLAFQIRNSDAETAYHQAMNLAQGEMATISKDCYNPQTRSKYTSYAAIDSAIRPAFTKCGFAMSFGSKASPHADHVIVTCRVSHKDGHKEEHELDVPTDGKGLKGGDMMTRTHATGSALTYAKRYLAGLIWNLSYGETDDDGNAASPRNGHANTPADTRDASAQHRGEAQPITEETKIGSVTIKGINYKEGTNSKGAWKAYFVAFDNGMEAATFSNTIGGLAETCMQDGVPVTILVKPANKPGKLELISLSEALP